MPPRRIVPVRDAVTIRVDGHDVIAERGEPIAVALAASGRLLLGRSAKYHRPRGAACYAGRCDGCLMRVDGRPSRATCRVPCEAGAEVETQNVLGSAEVDLLAAADWFFPGGLNHHEMFTWSKPINRAMQTVARRVAGVGRLPDEVATLAAPIDRACDVLVIGAGPSGLACAAEAARAGLETAVLDEEDQPGGHLGWESGAAGTDRAELAARTAREAGAVLIHPASALAIYDASERGGLAIADTQEALLRIRARRFVIAQGRHEGSWAFEGNDLPGVIGSEAASRLLARGVLPGDRVVLAAHDPARVELLARALREAGAELHGPIPLGELVRARGRNGVRACDLRSGERISCDAVVIAPPSSAVYELAAQAGVEVAWRGGSFELVASSADGATRSPCARAIGRASGLHDREAGIVQGVAAARAIARELGTVAKGGGPSG